jgi:outer membrane protein insertion porin family
VWKTSKYIESDFRKDKNAVITKYNEEGFRDARIIKDSLFYIDNRNIGLL